MGVIGCAMCVAGLEAALPWYVATAVVMSVLPFALVGGLALWVRRHAKNAATAPPLDSTRGD
ncbi:MAG: hypothetical protein HYU51_05205 [Candidatus Rokubacteria bacterium]|nr:hypothetical protein [Candidatus Rokubacteria bacterium]